MPLEENAGQTNIIINIVFRLQPAFNREAERQRNQPRHTYIIVISIFFLNMPSVEDPPKWIGPSSVYEVKNITLHDPGNRKLRVITIGGGVSGIMMAYKIQQECENVEHVVYERNSGIGGT